MLPLLRKAASARIVNVSSGLCSLTQNVDPSWPYYPVKILGMLTVQLGLRTPRYAHQGQLRRPGLYRRRPQRHRTLVTQTILWRLAMHT
jgi:hypothetical protein